jgi:hypothetical protein
MNSNKPEIKTLEKAFKGNLDLVLFYLTWIKNGLKAGKAYKELHPEVNDHSADTLGSRELKKVEFPMVMQAYGLDSQKYFEQLKDGLDATKWNDFTGEREADHKTRQGYHDKLGRLLGFEATPKTLIQQNIGEMKMEFNTYDESNPKQVAERS